MPSISLCMIVKDAQKTIARTLDSALPFVDEAVIVDTGSSDRTPLIVADQITAHGKQGRLLGFLATDHPEAFVTDSEETWKPFGIPGHYTNQVILSDFSAARNYGWSRATCDYLLWLDADDELQGGEHLQEIIAEMQARQIDTALFNYDYAHDDQGNVTCQLPRERLVRRSLGSKWHSPVHEVFMPIGLGKGYSNVNIKHLRQEARLHNPVAFRNLKLLSLWRQRVGDNIDPRILFYLGVESRFLWPDKAIESFREYCKISGWDEERASAHLFSGALHEQKKEYETALSEYAAATIEAPWNPDGFFGAARIAYYKKQWLKCIEWTERGFDVDKAVNNRAQVLMHDPNDRSWRPYVFYVVALIECGRPQDALRGCKEGLKHNPTEPHLLGNKKVCEDYLNGQTAQKGSPMSEKTSLKFNPDEPLEAPAVDIPTDIMATLAVQIWKRNLQNPVRAMQFLDSLPAELEADPKLRQARQKTMELLENAAEPARTSEPSARRNKPAPIKPTTEAIFPEKPMKLAFPVCRDTAVMLHRPAGPHLVHLVGLDKDGRTHQAQVSTEEWEKHKESPRYFVETRLAQGQSISSDPGVRFPWTIPLPIVGDPENPTLRIAVAHSHQNAQTVEILGSRSDGMPIKCSVSLADWEARQIVQFMEVEEPAPQKQIPEPAPPSGRTPESKPRISVAGGRNLDILLWTGPAWENWGPACLETTGIGGSETAAICLSRELVKRGHRVQVLSQCGPHQGIHDGVEYVPYEHALANPGKFSADIFIASRHAQALDYPFARKATFAWVHDIHLGEPNPTLNGQLQRVDRFFCLSNWHKNFYLQTYPFLSSDKIIVTKNGIDTDLFSPEPNKIGNRLIYASSPDRGLSVLLQIFPSIREQVPDAELHVYYGFHNWKQMTKIGAPQDLFKVEAFEKSLHKEDLGIFYHDRVSKSELAKAYLQAKVWAYPTWFTETYCIAAIEAAAGGCVPVSTYLAALPETVSHGFLLKPPNTDPKYTTAFVKRVVSLLRDETERRRYADEGRKYALANHGWDKVAASWERHFLAFLGDKPLTDYPAAGPLSIPSFEEFSA